MGNLSHKKLFKLGFVRYGAIAIVLAASLCLINAPRAAAQSIEDYFNISYDPVELSQDAVNGDEIFYATVRGSAICKQDLPLPVSEAVITSRIIAEHEVNGTTEILNSSYTVTIKPFPDEAGETYNIEKVIPLQFPASSESGNYEVIGELIDAKVRVGIWVDVSNYLPQYQTMGSVTTVPEAVELVEFAYEGCLDEGDRETVDSLVIPAGATDVEIYLDADADLDLELWDGATHVVGWKAEIGSRGPSTDTYEGDTLGYSGWDASEEYITADGPLGQAYTVKVYGFRDGCYDVTGSYMEPGLDYDPPVVTITVPDVSMLSPVTVTVSATDFSGVQLVWFAVYPDEYPEWWPTIATDMPLVAETTYARQGRITFTPGWAGTYTIEAGAVDILDNMTPAGTPVMATFEVVE